MREVAVLFARADSVYKAMPGCAVYDIERDAQTWPGGAPVVAHPPCRAWGRLRQFAKPRDGEKDLGPWAVNQVRRSAVFWNILPSRRCSRTAHYRGPASSLTASAAGRSPSISSSSAIGRKRRRGCTSSAATLTKSRICRSVVVGRRTASGRRRAIRGYPASRSLSARRHRHCSPHGSSTLRVAHHYWRSPRDAPHRHPRLQGRRPPADPLRHMQERQRAQGRCVQRAAVLLPALLCGAAIQAEGGMTTPLARCYGCHEMREQTGGIWFALRFLCAACVEARLQGRHCPQTCSRISTELSTDTAVIPSAILENLSLDHGTENGR